MAMIDVQGVSAILLQLAQVIIICIFIVAAVAGGLILWMKRKRWDYDVVWLNKDRVTGGYDKGGIFVDNKTKVKMFFLKQAKVGMNPDQVPWRLIGKTRVVFLIRYGVKNFRFIDTSGLGKGIKAEVGEEDVNWAVVDYERQKSVFGSDRLLQFLPIISLAVVGVIILIMIIMVLKKFDVLQDVAATLKDTAIILRDARSGTTVIQ